LRKNSLLQRYWLAAAAAYSLEIKMRTPTVTLSADDTIKEFIRNVTGGSTQDMMIGSEVLFAAGLAFRELSLLGGRLTIHFRATAGLKARLKAISDTAQVQTPPN
jgi:hypothetical protein